jgi:hypothetical protein
MWENLKQKQLGIRELIQNGTGAQRKEECYWMMGQSVKNHHDG